MASAHPSNIRVSVTFAQSTVFAGEDVTAIITFRNTAPISLLRKSVTPAERQRRAIPPQGKNAGRGDQLLRNGIRGGIGEGARGRGRGHRPTLSLSTNTSGLGGHPVIHETAGGSERVRPRHSRSISIVSLGGETSRGKGRGVPGHGRSASVQVGRTGFSSRTTPQLHSLPFPSASDEQSELPLSVRTPSPNFPTPSVARQEPAFKEFKFPMQPASHATVNEEQSDITSARSPRTHSSRAFMRNQSPKSDDEESSRPAINRVLSNASAAAGTPRASTDIYSISNHSDETLASEYPSLPPSTFAGGLLFRPAHSRQGSRLAVPQEQTRGPEALMMGYAQIAGTFTLDGSLVNTAPFDEVKRKGLISGAGGGGVVGLSSNNRNSGLFGSLGWNSLGSSLNNILGGGELSSIREMRNQSEKKEIPLVSTPQSILFVDLRLRPGEERSYEYVFTLPRGLPPSHKGRAMKVSYRLVIGVQRPGGGGNAGVKSIEVPFRVFGSVTGRGEILGHDLMTPYILLQTHARTTPLTPSHTSQDRTNMSKAPPSTEDEFLSYIEALLTRPSGSGLLSPTEGPRLFRRQSSLVEPEPQTQSEAIDLAILRSNMIGSSSSQSPNKFSIARSGRSVTVIELARPAYRIGETVAGMLDFEKSEIPVLWVRVWLETSEKVDLSLSMRSEGSVLRATRKAWSGMVENVIWARRVGFELSIPSSATPEFVTSGVTLEWKLKVEFTTPSLAHLITNRREHSDTDEHSEEDSEEEPEGFPELLEEVNVDERGKVLAPVERLGVETFEIAVPIRVYGAQGAGALDGEEEAKELPI